MSIPDLVLALAVLSTVHITSAQVGLRTAPLTAPRIRHHNENNNKNNKTGMELFSKWPTMEMNHRRGGSGKMESELAAIFRGVAYGVSTLPSTTVIPTTTTSTTTEAPVTKITKDTQQNPSQSHHNQKIQKDNRSEQRQTPSNPLNFPDWREAEFPQSKIHPIITQEPPIQYPYVESPDVTSRSTPSQEVKPTNGVTGVQVVRADVTEVEWIRALGVAWLVHVYTAAGLYSILALLALFCIIRVKADMHLLPTGYYITFHVLMFVAAILRCVHLFHDPYGAEQRLPQPLSKAVEETAWPCLTAALAVVVMAIVRAWQCPRLIPQHNYGPLGLALLTTVHLLMTLTSLLTAFLVPDQASALNAASRAVTLAWGSTVGIFGLFAIWKVGRDSRRYSSQFSLRFGINHLQTNTSLRNPRAILVYGTNLALVSCLTQISLAGLHLYALVGPHYILDIPPVYPWYWMAYHSTARAFEITTWVLLCTISVLNLGFIPNKRSDSSGETKLLTVLGCQCCGSSTSIATQDNNDDIHPNTCQTNRSVRNFTLLNNGKGGFQETLADPLMDSGKPVIRIEQNISLKNSPPYKETGSDVHLLWNNSSNNPSAPSIPPSMLFNESGFVRFKMNVDQSQAIDEVIRKSLQNLDLVSQIHDSKYQNKQLSQNQLNASEYSDDPPPYENTTASPPLIRKPSIGSPQSRSGGNIEQLLKNQFNTKLYTGHGRGLDNYSEAASTTDVSSPEATSPPPTSDAWSKYDSTCSSISAANSFDVKMYNDIEVSPYYQNPSSASYHMYSSLHQPSSRGHQLQQNTSYRFPNDVAYNNHEPNQSTSQLRALLSPKNTAKKLGPISMSSVESDQEIDMRLTNTRHTPQFKKSVSLSPGPKRSPHLNLRHDTPDSGLAMDYYGNTDETSGDDIHLASFRPCGHRPRRSQHSVATARHQQSPVMMHIDINSRQQQSPLISPSRPPLHPGSPILQERQRLQLQHQLQQRIQNEQLKQQGQQRQIEQLIQQRKLEQDEILRIQTDSPSWLLGTPSRENVNISGSARHQELHPRSSPLLFRSASTNASNSDIASECIDSEDEVKRDQNTSVESAYENVSEPITAEAWPPPARIIKQVAL